MSVQDKYQRPAKELHAAAARQRAVCEETQRDTARRTVRLCSESPRAKTPGTFAHDVVTAAEQEFTASGRSWRFR